MKSRLTPARRAAFETLRRVEGDTTYVSHLLASERYLELIPEDRSLLQELVLGVLRWQGQLDFLIERYSRRPLGSLDRDVLVALRLGLYQLRFLDRVPAHAAIDQAVTSVRQRKLASAAPFVNAILRAAQRELTTRVEELIPMISDPLQRLSIETSHPIWLLERWTGRFGVDEARALALSANAPPTIAFRFNGLRATANRTRAWFAENGIAIRDSSLVSNACVIESGHLSANSEPVKEGWIYLQDEASQLVARLAVDSTQTHSASHQTLDLCAAPGSKTTLIASLLPQTAMVVAADLHHHRLKTLRRLAGRLGVLQVQPVQLDATQTLPFAKPAVFDTVVVDAPCSGLGTLQRNPEIKWRTSAARIPELALLQRQLIEQGAQYLRSGGLLTYSVCSTEPEEGEEIVAGLKDRHPEFRDITRERLTELGHDASRFLTSQYGARSFTHRHGTESFFFCVLWKRR